MLRAQGRLAPLRVGQLLLHFPRADWEEQAAAFAAALADATLQPGLTRVRLINADARQEDVMDALVDAMLARRLPGLTLRTCTPPAGAPLARLLAGGTLRQLAVSGRALQAVPTFPDGPEHAAVLADALRGAHALTSLELYGVGLFEDVEAGTLLLGALMAHPSLQTLVVSGEVTRHQEALGAALAAIVAANAPALRQVSFDRNALGDFGLAPILDALARNRHLRVLDIRRNAMSEELARAALLPAVRACASLRVLCCRNYFDDEPAATEAELLVRRRAERNT